MNVGPSGVRSTASIPGTGVSFHHQYGSDRNGTPPDSSPDAPRPFSPSRNGHSQQRFANAAPVLEVHSASTELLTSESLKELKTLIQTAFKAREDIRFELEDAMRAEETASERFNSWNNGFLLKRLFRKRFTERTATLETETAKVAELKEQLRLSTITTYIELEQEQSELFYRLRDEFARLAECDRIWDVKTRQATDQFHERTTAHVKIERNPVQFGLGRCDLIQWDQDVPQLRNSKGGELFLYPGFLLYRAARQAFSVIEYHDLKGEASAVSFHETDRVPSDGKVIGQTWFKANKDGSRDKRFAGNYQIPILKYGQIEFRSDNGLWEEFHVSHPESLLAFLNALKGFANSFAAVNSA